MTFAGTWRMNSCRSRPCRLHKSLGFLVTSFQVPSPKPAAAGQGPHRQPIAEPGIRCDGRSHDQLSGSSKSELNAKINFREGTYPMSVVSKRTSSERRVTSALCQQRTCFVVD